jgi:hypothetical protein
MNATKSISRTDRKTVKALVWHISRARVRIVELTDSPQSDVTRLMIQEAYYDMGVANLQLDSISVRTGLTRAELIALAK